MSKLVEEKGKVQETFPDVKEDVSKVNSLSQNEALQILISSVKVAQRRGAFELEETEVILKAIKIFTQPQV